MIYKFFTDEFGWIQIAAEDEDGAKKVMERFDNARGLEAVPREPDEVIVTITDSLAERRETLIEEAKAMLDEYIEETGGELPNQLPDEVCDYIRGQADSSTPVYYKEIKGLWYLYWELFEDAYDNAGVGNNPIENNGQFAILFYLEQQAIEAAEAYLRDLTDEFEAEALADE